MPEIERAVPAYLQILAHLRDKIVSGELGGGDQLPSERAIADGWGVSRPTATRALTALSSEGLVRIERGIGAIVIDGVLHRAARDRFTRARKTGRIYTAGEYARIVSAEIAPAPAAVADAFGIDVGAPVIRRRRVTYGADHQPVSSSTSWLSADLAETAPALLNTDRIKGGTPLYVEEKTGRAQHLGRDLIDVRAATEQDAEDLGVPIGSPVKAGTNFVWDSNGDLIEYGEYVSPPGRASGYDYSI
jgi:DNA-binding GntR family transcriptional regulator